MTQEIERANLTTRFREQAVNAVGSAVGTASFLRKRENALYVGKRAVEKAGKIVSSKILSARVVGTDGNYTVEPRTPDGEVIEVEVRVMNKVSLGGIIMELFGLTNPATYFNRIKTRREAEEIAIWVEQKAREENAPLN